MANGQGSLLTIESPTICNLYGAHSVNFVFKHIHSDTIYWISIHFVPLSHLQKKLTESAKSI